MKIFRSKFIQIPLSTGKGKGHPRKDQEGPEAKQMYSSGLALTPALDGVGGQRHDPAALSPSPRERPVPTVG